MNPSDTFARVFIATVAFFGFILFWLPGWKALVWLFKKKEKVKK